MKFTIKAIASVMILGFLFVGCGLDEDDVVGELTNPVPGATADLVVETAPEVMLGLMDAILPAPTVPKPTTANITSLIAVTDKNCGSGGSVTFSDITDTTFAATINECADENVVINGAASGTFGPLLQCDLPSTMSAVFNGTVDVDGQVLTFTNFGVNATAISYGPDCDLDGEGASVTAILTGAVSGEFSGLTLGFDYGTVGLTVDATSILDMDNIKGNGLAREVIMTLNGTVAIDTPCQAGNLTITTDIALKTVQPSVCPVEGQITVSGDFGSDTVVFNGDCDRAACAL